MKTTSFFVVALVVLPSVACLAQSAEREPRAVLELGGSIERSVTEHQSSVGPTLGIEVTPIEDWLELEAGVTPLFKRHSTEIGADLLFKKPWTLSDRNEVMLGVGPEWVHTSALGATANAVAVEVVPDLMFWASNRHRFGWYLEPSYEYRFGAAREHSVAIAGGILVGLP